MACLERQFNHIRGTHGGAKQAIAAVLRLRSRSGPRTRDARAARCRNRRHRNLRDAEPDNSSKLPVTARFGGSFRLRRAGRGSS